MQAQRAEATARSPIQSGAHRIPWMNYLAHLLLAGEDPQRRLGGLIADFVRGRVETLAAQYPAPVVRGIVEHRRIDSFSERHPHFQASRSRISPARRRVSGIIVDVAYDHFLSVHWDSFCPQPRGEFIESTYDLLERHHGWLPERLQQIAPRMIAHDWLGSYAELDVLGIVFDRMSQRMRRSNSLAGALEEVEREYAGLEADFLLFFPRVARFAGDGND